MKRNKRHHFSSSKQMLQYGTRNGIGPFTSKWPRLVQRRGDTADLQLPVDLGKNQGKETAPSTANAEREQRESHS